MCPVNNADEKDEALKSLALFSFPRWRAAARCHEGIRFFFFPSSPLFSSIFLS